jgi:hypothetical protein
MKLPEKKFKVRVVALRKSMFYPAKWIYAIEYAHYRFFETYHRLPWAWLHLSRPSWSEEGYFGDFDEAMELAKTLKTIEDVERYIQDQSDKLQKAKNEAKQNGNGYSYQIL